MDPKNSVARRHWWPLSHAVMVALYTTAFASTRRSSPRISREQASSHWLPFPQALIAAL